MKLSEIIVLDEGFVDSLKSLLKKAPPKSNAEMLDAFEKHGGENKNELSSWQLGWAACLTDPSADPAHLVSKLKSQQTVDVKSFMLGFNSCAKSKGMKIYGDVGSSDLKHSDLSYREIKNHKSID